MGLLEDHEKYSTILKKEGLPQAVGELIAEVLLLKERVAKLEANPPYHYHPENLIA